ncbi:meiotic recombination protein SPO11 [Aricia agestis]|uniref:meiotic recombination protein SPO11 n=1 Tax=Aricia agestis TaxID=91739 RepID=UPI001C20529A|nr:meiotic recombination protein SPO11 [Aricia agestis]
MELINKELLKRTDLPLDIGAFKQDPKLVAAIDKLFIQGPKSTKENTILPGRKLNFSEVQQFLKKPGENASTSTKEVNTDRKTIIKKIEQILDDINRCAETGEKPTLIIRNQKLWSNCVYDMDRVALKSLGDAKTTTLQYCNASDKSRFNTIIFVLTKVHELLQKNLSVTKRELFYQNLARFRNQGNVDVGVRDVCCLLELPPWSLGIVATAKGLIAGPLKIYHQNGSVTDCMTAGGTLVPQDVNGIVEFRSTAKYILVVEKDAIFQKLLDEGALVRLGPVIILTGKGYPDIVTRQLLCRLVAALRLPALALVDADPHGFEIFLTYKYGSLAHSHLSSNLSCTTLRLLGARPRDVAALAPTAARLPLTARDKRKLNALISRPYLNTPTGVVVKADLREMLSSGYKAEVEAVAPTTAALCDFYLPSKLIHGDFVG